MTRARRFVGVARILVGLFALTVIVIQITDRLLNNEFDPAEYFSYFTIQSILITIVVLLVGGWMALRLPEDTVLYTSVRLGVVAYAIVTAGVYNLLLRSVPYEGYQGIQWLNEVEHVWLPLFVLLDWLFSPGRPALPFKAMFVAAVYPLAWLAYTLIRGVFFTGEYPYPFLDPANGGWASVGLYIVGLSAFILAIAAAGVAYSRARRRRGTVESVV
ncbi:Pr6Pr family membrane protein [soil metagenome]